MKLIIDIDDELVETAKFAVHLDMGSDYVKSIANGIPLDKIREEIEQASYEHYFEYGEYIGEDTRKERIINTNKVLQIIDKYKAESEVSE